MDPVAFALLRSRLFDALPYAAFETLLAQVERREVPAGQVLVEEGATADAFFVLVSGELEVFTTDRTGAEVHLDVLNEGEHFGEQAILAGGRGTRSASIRGRAPTSEVARLGTRQLDAILETDPALRTELAALGRRQEENRIARRTELVQQLLAGAEHGATLVEHPNGHVLFHQGAPADTVYVVLSGSVELLAAREGAQLHVARVGSGMLVGRVDTAQHETTAVVDGDARLLQVSKAALDHLASGEVGTHLAVLDRVWDLPQRGFVTQYLGSVDGQSCVTQVFRLADGRTVVSSHAIGSPFVRLVASDTPIARTLTTPDGTLQVGLSHGGVLVVVEARGESPALPTLFGRAIDGKPLHPSEEATLTESGVLAVTDEGFACTCMRVTRLMVGPRPAPNTLGPSCRKSPRNVTR